MTRLSRCLRLSSCGWRPVRTTRTIELIANVSPTVAHSRILRGDSGRVHFTRTGFINALAVVVGLLLAKHVNAQTEVGSALADGQIIVKLYVTVDQTGMPYGRPISHFALLVVAPSGERSTVATDDAGSATLHLTPGVYRVASFQPLEWNGRHLVWDLPLQVREHMHALDLTPHNSAVAVATNADGAPASSGAVIDASASTLSSQGARKDAAAAPPQYLYKSPGEAALFSFLVPGVGQMYNGQVGKGVGLLLLSTGRGRCRGRGVHRNLQ